MEQLGSNQVSSFLLTVLAILCILFFHDLLFVRPIHKRKNDSDLKIYVHYVNISLTIKLCQISVIPSDIL